MNFDNQNENEDTFQWKIRPLEEPLILYVDDSPESKRAEELLKSAQVEYIITDGPVEPYQRKPLVLHNAGFHQGYESIKNFLELLQFWSDQPYDKGTFKDDTVLK